MTDSIGSGIAEVKTLKEPGPSSKPNFGDSSEDDDVHIISNTNLIQSRPVTAMK